jgi:hypothetical protein
MYGFLVLFKILTLLLYEQAEAVAVKNAVSSAVDVMQALISSICYLQSKVRSAHL